MTQVWNVAATTRTANWPRRRARSDLSVRELIAVAASDGHQYRNDAT